MNRTHRINLVPAHQEDDDAILNELARKAVGAILVGFLALTLASVGALAYVLVTDRAAAGEGVRLELLGGQCQVEPIGSGIWYQDEYPHELHLSAGCLQVSISEILARRGTWGLGLRLGYVDLGTTRMDSEFAILDQEQHLVPDGSRCDHVTLSGCKGRGRSAQRARGISLGALAEREVGARVRLGAELGLYLYSGSFDVSIDVHNMPAPTRWDLHWQDLQLSPYLGATLQRGPFLVLARVYTQIRAAEHGCGGCSGFTKGQATQITAGLSVPF